MDGRQVATTVIDYSKMSFDDFESSDVIDLTRLDATHHHTGCDSSVQPVFKKMKTKKTRPVPVVLPQHLKEEQEILDFLNSDRSGKVETILRNAGVFEEQWIQFPFNELYVNPAYSDLDPLDPERCKNKLSLYY